MTCDMCGAMGMKHEIKGETEQGVMDNMQQHMEKGHPEDFQKMMGKSKEEQEMMMDEARKKIQDEV